MQESNRRRTAVAVLVFVAGAGCSGGDCITGKSSVELRLPGLAWTLSQFCVDDRCLAAEERQPVHEDNLVLPPDYFVSYAVNVPNRPETYHYRIVIVPPGGAPLVREGEVPTAGNMSGGENCRPRFSTASIIVTSDGRVVLQAP